MTNPNDTAQPILISEGYGSFYQGIGPNGESLWAVNTGGLTKREYFAVMAMQGLVTKINGITFDIDGAAVRSVQAADELIKALNKRP